MTIVITVLTSSGVQDTPLVKTMQRTVETTYKAINLDYLFPNRYKYYELLEQYLMSKSKNHIGFLWFDFIY